MIQINTIAVYQNLCSVDFNKSFIAKYEFKVSDKFDQYF